MRYKTQGVCSRAISDKADDSATVDYPVFEAKAITCDIKLKESVHGRYPLK